MGEEQGPIDRLTERAREWRTDRRIIGVCCAGIAVAATVAWWRAGSSGAAPPVAAAPPTTSASSPASSTTSTPTALVVNVVGAVRAPGVVRIAAGGRVVDAIAAGGGATADADLTRLNLAAPVADGARIAVPKLGQPPPALDPTAVSGGGGAVPTGSAAGPVNINTATAEELDALPGVGPATAAAIVREREQHGPFRSPADLDRVRGIGPAKLEQLRDLVAV
jgi:competence protein ComEA